MNTPIPFPELLARAMKGPFSSQYGIGGKNYVRAEMDPSVSGPNSYFNLFQTTASYANAELVCRLLTWAHAGGPDALFVAIDRLEALGDTKSGTIRILKDSLQILDGGNP